MLRRIEQTIRERKLIRNGMHIVAAVSGGADSVAMLHALVELHRGLGFKLTVLHVDHRLRGRSSTADAAFVSRLCRKLDVRCMVVRRDVAREKTKTGVSIEMAARDARLEEFRRVGKKIKAHAVATAHHADDQAETVLMRLLAGSGLDGLAGMDYVSEPLPGLMVIRPMLDVTRGQIQSYLRERKAVWREDASNKSIVFRRNRIRHEILPYLRRQVYAGVDQVLVRLSGLVRAENEILHARTQAFMARIKIKGTENLSRRKLRKHHLADQRRILRSWLAASGLLVRDVDFEWIEHTRDAILHSDRGSRQLNASCRIVWSGDAVSIAQPAQIPELTAVRLNMPGITVLADHGLHVKVEEARGFRDARSMLGVFPVSGYLRRDGRGALVIRGRLPGDSIQPTGMAGTVKIKDVFINSKLPQALRSAYPLIASDIEVVWVPGYRIHRQWAVPNSRAASWKVTIRRLPKKA